MDAPLSIFTTPQPARFTVDEFMRLNETGVFEKYSKSELLEGEIVVVNAQFSRHARIKSNLMVSLANSLRALGSPLDAWCEVSINLSPDTMPEPDIVLTSFRGTGPVPLETVALVVEVSDATLDIDLGRKLRIYAEASIAEYWVIDLNGEQALRLWEPTGGGYVRRDETPLGDLLESATIGGLAVVTEK